MIIDCIIATLSLPLKSMLVQFSKLLIQCHLFGVHCSFLIIKQFVPLLEVLLPYIVIFPLKVVV